MAGQSKPCGNGYISADKECKQGAGGARKNLRRAIGVGALAGAAALAMRKKGPKRLPGQQEPKALAPAKKQLAAAKSDSVRLDIKAKRCGNGWIPADKECRVGSGGGSGKGKAVRRAIAGGIAGAVAARAVLGPLGRKKKRLPGQEDPKALPPARKQLAAAKSDSFDSAYIDDYFRAQLDLMGVNSNVADPFEYWKGYSGLDPDTTLSDLISED